MAAAATLDLIEPEVVPFDPPSPKTQYPRTKHEVDRTTGCRYTTEIFQIRGRSVVGRVTEAYLC